MFGSALLQPVRSVRVSLSVFFIATAIGFLTATERTSSRTAPGELTTLATPFSIPYSSTISASCSSAHTPQEPWTDLKIRERCCGVGASSLKFVAVG